MSEKNNKSNINLAQKYNLDDENIQLLNQYDNTSKNEFIKQGFIFTVIALIEILLMIFITSSEMGVKYYKFLNVSEIMTESDMSMMLSEGRFLGILMIVGIYIYIVSDIVTYNLNRDAWIKYFLYTDKEEKIN